MSSVSNITIFLLFLLSKPNIKCTGRGIRSYPRPQGFFHAGTMPKVLKFLDPPLPTTTFKIGKNYQIICQKCKLLNWLSIHGNYSIRVTCPKIRAVRSMYTGRKSYAWKKRDNSSIFSRICLKINLFWNHFSVKLSVSWPFHILCENNYEKGNWLAMHACYLNSSFTQVDL